MLSPSQKFKIKYTIDPLFWKYENFRLLIDNLKFKNGTGLKDDKIHLAETAEWLKRAQDINSDGGFSGRYKLKGGWTSSYPETTGYIIPTLISLSEEYKSHDYIDRAERAINFLLKLQLKDGGFPGGEIHENTTEPSMFNTGQIINGLLEWYKYSREEKVLDALIRAGNWMVSVQDKDGSWKKFTYNNLVVTYSTHSSCWLADLGNHINNKIFLDSAYRHFEWALTQQDKNTGWFDLAGFTSEYHSERKSVTHTIAYTLWGILFMSEIFNSKPGIEAVEKAALNIAEVQDNFQILPGELNFQWKPVAQYSCLTGIAQMSLIWLKLYSLKKNDIYLKASIKGIDSIKKVQNLKTKNPAIRGSIPGSFPVWGDYIFMALPNWAAKFFIDALIEKKKIR